MSTYLLVDLACISIPLLASFYPKFAFYKLWLSFLPACFITGLIFILWDIYFTHLGIWGFNPKHLLGLYFYDLPLEEYLFFFCIPYACVFSYFGFKQLFSKINLQASLILNVLSWLLLVIGLLCINQLYTSTTFISLFILLRIVLYQKKKFLDHFLATYLFTLVPFLLANGVLTGSWIDEEVVWYNNAHNLGIRIFTIPVEDSMYGMLLILLNIYFFEFFSNRSGKSADVSV